LVEDADYLPDEPDLDDQIRFASGAKDGIFGHHVGASAPNRRAKQLTKSLIALLERSTRKNVEHFYQLATREPILEVADLFVEEVLGASHRFDPDRFVAVARCLALSAADREAVKLGIVMLGLVTCDDSEDRESLLTLGTHDEFTLYVAVALSRRGASELTLLELAKKVEGWGRIALVERFAETQEPEVKEWLLRDGYRNSVMYEYTALICAEAGGLIEALRSTEVDDQLLISAGDILRALTSGTPGPGLEAYADGTEAMELFAGHVARRPPRLEHYLHVDAIRRALQEFSPARAECRAYLESSGWMDMISDGLRSDDDLTFHLADTVASMTGVDTWQVHFERVSDDPGDDSSWFRLMQQTDDTRIHQVTRFAEQRLPLAEIATGPSDALGLGSGYSAHSALDFILQDLGRFPGAGLQLICAGLRSPVVRNRNMALRAAFEWGTTRWPNELEEAISRAAAEEPCDDVRERMQRVLNGQPMEPGENGHPS
jgi:hypothetical protein